MFQAIFGGGKEQFEGAALFIHKSMIPKYAPEALCFCQTRVRAT